MDLPWDFVVSGVPVSSQSKNTRAKNQYKQRVADAARDALPDDHKPMTAKLQIHITYYYDGVLGMDVDNCMKLIQDALCGLVYEDDSQLIDRHGHIRDVNGTYDTQVVTPSQLLGFSYNGPFVHARIEAPGNMEVLP